jgi:hypothetical protein
VEQHLLLLKANRLFMQKKDLKMIHKDVPIAEEQRNSRETTLVVVATEAAERALAAATDGKFKESVSSLFC